MRLLIRLTDDAHWYWKISPVAPTVGLWPTAPMRVAARRHSCSGASGMFATMYSTQAILPELGRELRRRPRSAGLTVSVLIFAIALGAWLWGPLSDRIGRRRALITASALLVAPAALAPLAPSFGMLLACRLAQGLCMPGLLTVGVPYVMATFGQRYGARVMGWYVGSLVAGGLIGRVGVSLLTAASAGAARSARSRSCRSSRRS